MSILKKLKKGVSSFVKAITPQVTVDPNKDLKSLGDKATPDITLGDPTKLVTKPFEGAQNAVGSIGANAVDNAGNLVSNAVNEAGNALSQPGAAAVLGAAGAYFGVPNLSNLAGSLSQNQYPEPGSAASRSIEIPYVKDNKNLIIGAVIGVVVLIITVVFISRKKGNK